MTEQKIQAWRHEKATLLDRIVALQTMVEWYAGYVKGVPIIVKSDNWWDWWVDLSRRSGLLDKKAR